MVLLTVSPAAPSFRLPCVRHLLTFLSQVGVPLLAVGAGALWFKSTFIEATCPSCSTPVTLVRGQTTSCLACGTALLEADGEAIRVGSYNTETDVSTGRQTVADVLDVDVEVVDDADRRR